MITPDRLGSTKRISSTHVGDPSAPNWELSGESWAQVTSSSGFVSASANCSRFGKVSSATPSVTQTRAGRWHSMT